MDVDHLNGRETATVMMKTTMTANPPLLSRCKTGLRSPMTRAAHHILCSNS